ncbi:type II toxin-antitoxin system antitoxin VapB26 [soil metagenome]
MQKTTVYLPDHLKDAVERLAERRGTSEAAVIREAIERFSASDRPRPRGALFASADGTISERVDELLGGDEDTAAFGR